MNENLGWAWHVNHEQLLELLTAPIEEHLQHIREVRSESEVALQERLLQPVQGEISNQVLEAWQACRNVLWSYRARAWFYVFRCPLPIEWKDLTNHVNIKSATRNDMTAAWERVLESRQAFYALPEIQALHEQECPNCPWDGKTIFSWEE